MMNMYGCIKDTNSAIHVHVHVFLILKNVRCMKTHSNLSFNSVI